MKGGKKSMRVPVQEDKYLSSNGISENTQALNGEKSYCYGCYGYDTDSKTIWYIK